MNSINNYNFTDLETTNYLFSIRQFQKLQKKVDKEKKETIKPNKIFIGIKKTPRKR